MSKQTSKTKSQRTRDLAKIHLAKKQLGMDDETYRDMLWTVARVRSSADLDLAGRQAVLEHLQAKGFKAFKKSRTRRPVGRQAGLIYHIWNCLADAGVVHSRAGLGAWLKANTKHLNGIGFEAPELCSRDAKEQIIEQLKKWADRENVNWK